MSITAKELAKQLNLSEAAISMALNNKPGVSTLTRKRVLEAAASAGYDFSRISNTNEAPASNGTLYFVIYRKNGAVVPNSLFTHIQSTAFWYRMFHSFHSCQRVLIWAAGTATTT